MTLFCIGMVFAAYLALNEYRVSKIEEQLKQLKEAATKEAETEAVDMTTNLTDDDFKA